MRWDLSRRWRLPPQPRIAAFRAAETERTARAVLCADARRRFSEHRAPRSRGIVQLRRSPLWTALVAESGRGRGANGPVDREVEDVQDVVRAEAGKLAGPCSSRPRRHIAGSDMNSPSHGDLAKFSATPRPPGDVAVAPQSVPMFSDRRLAGGRRAAEQLSRSGSVRTLLPLLDPRRKRRRREDAQRAHQPAGACVPAIVRGHVLGSVSCCFAARRGMRATCTATSEAEDSPSHCDMPAICANASNWRRPAIRSRLPLQNEQHGTHQARSWGPAHDALSHKDVQRVEQSPTRSSFGKCTRLYSKNWTIWPSNCPSPTPKAGRASGQSREGWCSPSRYLSAGDDSTRSVRIPASQSPSSQA